MRVTSRLLLSIARAGLHRDGRLRPGAGRDESKRMVLVELYTSQGCDMCPTAEKILGSLAEKDRRIVPIAFHVDYFNDPWKDVFSDPLYSQRQMTYNKLYTGPKNREYGLYYTPMLMIDGVAVGERPGPRRGRGGDPPGPGQETRRGARRSPSTLKEDGRFGHGDDQGDEPVAPGREVAAPGLRRAPRGRRRDGHPLGREHGQVARRSLPGTADEIRVHRTGRQVSRDATVRLRDRADVEPQNLRLAVFVQDKRTGVVHQAADIPWRSSPGVPASVSGAR